MSRENLVDPCGKKERKVSLVTYHELHQGDTWEESPCAVISDFIIWENVRSLGVTTAKDHGTSQTFARINQASRKKYWVLKRKWFRKMSHRNDHVMFEKGN